MKLFNRVAALAVDTIIRYAQRDPMWHLKGYMNRWWVLREHWWTLGCSARVHEILRSDNDRHFHDHPWWSVSIILRGRYHEHFPYPAESKWRSPGSIIVRSARTQHQLHIPPHTTTWSLFIMGPKGKERWGFYTPHGKIPHTEYAAYLQRVGDTQHRRQA